MKKAIKILGILLIILFLTSCGKNEEKDLEQPQEVQEPEPVVSKVNIVDVNSKTRPIAVMINNLNEARTVQSGLQKAYMVYEIIVEGGITRYLALYKDVDAVTLGSVRSSRHYYLDYVLENDAVYVHWGYSDQAKSDIKSLNINNINGLVYEGTYFYRIDNKNISLEHRGFTNMDMIQKAIAKLKYRNTTDSGLLLDYSADAVTLSEGTDAKTVTLKYSNYITNKYEYDEENERYIRYVNGAKQIDHENDEVLTVKNIIVYQVDNNTISGDKKNRQELDNVGSGTGYFISNGMAVEINWSKASREAKTQYTLKDGTKLVVNDGNTFIQIMPTSGKITME